MIPPVKPASFINLTGSGKKGFQFRSRLKIRIFGRDQGEAGDQPAGILKYVEDLNQGLNADIG
jgi:hypothetical protein